MHELLRVLMIDDSETDVSLTVRQLTRQGYTIDFLRVDTLPALNAALQSDWHLVICDYSMPELTGLQALNILRATGSDTPFIFFSGLIDEDTAIAALETGAQDYVMKSNQKRLIVSVKRVLREAELRRDNERNHVAAALHLQRLVDSLNEALAVQTSLLQEVDHRVNNNLAVVMSLLGRQADAVRDTNAAAANLIMQSQRRIRAMAFIYQHLDRQHGMERVQLGGFVECLSQDLFAAMSGNAGIVKSVKAVSVELGIERSVPFGLILNELLSNALQHAFPEGRTGAVSVHLRQGTGRAVTLAVEDDGQGFPKGFAWRKAQTVGLKMVRVLVKQLDGRIDLQDGSGTRFAVDFTI